nr:MAG TPA: Protein of unknown function (DUF551) [Caudoviricetes sp.]
MGLDITISERKEYCCRKCGQRWNRANGCISAPSATGKPAGDGPVNVTWWMDLPDPPRKDG